jgi:two-component system nitrate/nitrite response regulator NarL
MNAFPRRHAPTIRIIIADASRIKCQLLDNEFKRRRCGIDVVRTVFDSSGLLKAVAEAEAKVVITHTNLRDGIHTGLRIVRQICLNHPEVHVILLLDSSHRDHVVQAFRYGVHGVFCGDESIDALCKCVEAVSSGQIWASNKEIRFLLEALSQPSSVQISYGKNDLLLTPREEEVVRLASEGLSNKDISVQLNLSEHTVRNYLYRIFDKMGISSRVELILRSLSYPQSLKLGRIALPAASGAAAPPKDHAE